MLKARRIVVSIFLLVVLTQGRLCAQRADDTINSALERLSQALIESFNQLERREFRNRLAVLEFENGSELARQQNLGSVFSEILTNYLSDNTNVFDVYERRQLDNVLREQELALSDAADQNEVIEIGKLTGAHLLVLGSVLQVGNNVQVIARLVETETGQILVSHAELIPKSVFVGITEYLVELRNSVLLDYTLLFLDDTAVSSAALVYRYSFSRGLSFAFQLFLGGTHGVIPTSTTVGSGPSTEYFDWESSFTEMGLAVLFGLSSASLGALRWELQLGPVLAAYHDETGLIRFTENNGNDLYNGGEEIDNWYMMFGLSGSVFLDLNLSRHVGLYLGGQFQFFPEQSIKEEVWYKNSGDSWSTVIFYRDIRLTGAVIKAGMRYSF